VLAGCSGGSAGTGAPATTTASTAATTTAAPATAAPGTSRPATTSTTAAGGSGATTTTTTAPGFPTAQVVLKAGALSDVTFGTPRTEALATLEGLVGPGRPGAPASECPGGLTSVVWEVPGLTAYFEGDTFTGWHTAPTRKVALNTAEGLGANATVARFRSVYGDRFSWATGSTLGNEFAVRGTGDWMISGVARGQTDASAVESLWSGRTCIAR
jgi:hypothetical protein